MTTVKCAEVLGDGYGAQLLPVALGKVVRAAEIGWGRLIVVDAIDDEAYEFYEHFDFIPVKNRRGRLVMKMSTAGSSVAVIATAIAFDPLG